jgi:hypothetical protein
MAQPPRLTQTISRARAARVVCVAALPLGGVQHTQERLFVMGHLGTLSAAAPRARLFA